MAILTVNDVTVSFGEETILEGITLEMQKGEHIGLVGVNGSGKTTLFKTLTGEYTPDTGSVIFAKDCTPGYMEQHVCRDFEKTAFEEVMTVFAPLLEMEKELESLSSKLSQNPPEQEMEALILRQTLCGRGRADLPLPGTQCPLRAGVYRGADSEQGGGAKRRAEGKAAACQNAFGRRKPSAAG